MKCSTRKGIHKFEARYDEVPNSELIKRIQKASGNDRNILILKVYVKDICINCGTEIKK